MGLDYRNSSVSYESSVARHCGHGGRLCEAGEQITRGLTMLAREGGSGNFMILSSADIYVQFAGARGSSELECEVIAESFIRGRSRLDRSRTDRLHQLGFARRIDGAGVWRRFRLAGEETAREIAQIAILIFETVYNLNAETRVQIKLVLE